VNRLYWIPVPRFREDKLHGNDRKPINGLFMKPSLLFIRICLEFWIWNLVFKGRILLGQDYSFFPSFSSSTLIPYLRIFCCKFWRNIWALREASEMFHLLSLRMWVM